MFGNDSGRVRHDAPFYNTSYAPNTSAPRAQAGAYPSFVDGADSWQHGGSHVPGPSPTSPLNALRPTPAAAQPFSGRLEIDYTKSVTCNYPITLQGRLSADEFEDIHARCYWGNMEAQISCQKSALWVGAFTVGMGAFVMQMMADSRIESKTRKVISQLNREYAHRGIGFRYVTESFTNKIYMDVL